MTIPAVRLINITKRFPGVIANYRVNFEVLPGEIHALLGENGAGKSTLMNILTGLYKPDEGEIELGGQRVEFKGPADAIEQGIGVVFQHFKLVPNQTVAENIALGMRRPRFRLDLKKVEHDLTSLGQKMNLQVKPSAVVKTLSVGEQQRVEILKVLYLGAKILALDEPTASLTPQETQGLFVALRGLAAEGYAIIFISHKLEEVTSLASRATILRKGQSVATLDLTGQPGEKEKLARLMIGRETDAETSSELGLTTLVGPSQVQMSGPVVLEAKDLSVVNAAGQQVLHNVSFDLAQGEIVAIVGVAGNGQRELTETLAGLHRLKTGTFRLSGQKLDGCDPREISQKGVAFVPEDRLGMGLVAGLDLEDNYLLRKYWEPQMRRGPFLRRKQAGVDLAAAITHYEIKVGDAYAPARLMSGGNLQKLLLARELASQPRVLIVANPTRGLDIGASAYVHERLREACQRGAAVLLILEDLDEALALASRLLVMYEGRIVGECLPVRSNENLQKIGLWMAGAKAVSTVKEGDS